MNNRLLPLAALLCAVTSAFAEPLAIFGRQDHRPVATTPARPHPAEEAFRVAYRQDRAAAARLECELPLVNPPAWGKTISAQTGGVVRSHRRFAGGYVCRLELHGLRPNQAYILCLNGNPKLDGNRLLPTPVPGLEEEKYYDFLDVKSDARGEYQGDLGVYLPPGRYDVRLYVKDADDFKIVLYHDYSPFVVE